MVVRSHPQTVISFLALLVYHPFVIPLVSHWAQEIGWLISEWLCSSPEKNLGRMVLGMTAAFFRWVQSCKIRPKNSGKWNLPSSLGFTTCYLLHKMRLSTITRIAAVLLNMESPKFVDDSHQNIMKFPDLQHFTRGKNVQIHMGFPWP